MKYKLMNSVIVTALALGVIVQASATVGSDTSKKEMEPGVPYIQVGASAAGHHGVGDLPAVGVSTLYNGMMVSIGGFVVSKYQDANDIAVVSATTAKLPPSHAGMGAFNFAQVASDPVYFGEWSSTGVPGDTTHTAFYAGKDVTTNMPVAGIATYVVKGVSQYTGNNLLNGTLTADFGKTILAGSMTNADMTISINNAKIDLQTARFSGEASANGLAGTTTGHFFGDAAAAVAGVASFSDHTKDTAFGGSKQ